MKKFFIPLFLIISVFTFAIIGYAHPGGTDGNGGHYNKDTGEYHYHHGYSAHQHPNGVCPYEVNADKNTKNIISKDGFENIDCLVELDSLEKSIRLYFDYTTEADEMVDELIFNSGIKIYDLGTYYVELEDIEEVVINYFGGGAYAEDIRDCIIFNPDVVMGTPNELFDTENYERDNTIEHTEETTTETEEGRVTLEQRIDDAIDSAKYICISLVIIFFPGILAGVVGYLKDRFIINRKK